MLHRRNDRANKPPKWRYIGLALILSEVLILIGFVTYENVMMCKDNTSKRILLSSDSSALSRKEEMLVKHTTSHLNKMTDEHKDVLKKCGDMVKQLSTKKSMDYMKHFNILFNDETGHDNKVVHALKNTVMDILDRKSKDSFQLLTGDPSILQFSGVLQELAKPQENYAVLVRDTIQIITQLSEFMGAGTDYLDLFHDVTIRAVMEEATQEAKTAEDFKEIFNIVNEFDQGFMVRHMVKVQAAFGRMIEYAVGVENIEKDPLHEILVEMPAFKDIPNDDKVMAPFVVLAKIFKDGADTSEKQEILLRYVSLVTGIPVDSMTDEELSDKAAQVYAETYGQENGKFLWDLWDQVSMFLTQKH